MLNVKLHIVQLHTVCSQIITGYYNLSKAGYLQLEIIDDSNSIECRQYSIPAVYAEINGMILFYDMMDGYLNTEAITHYIKKSDLYFKRSYSKKENEVQLSEYVNKIFPLRLNYFLTFAGNLINEKPIMNVAKIVTHRTPQSHFTGDVYESKPEYKIRSDIKVLYWARLWEPENYYTEEINADRIKVNNQRIEMIRGLKTPFPSQFIGGLKGTKYAQEKAPDIICNSKYDDKGAYINLLKSADIGIATVGLHNSNGWKLGEYVAAAKGIVSEKLYYEVPGDFVHGRNYLEYSDLETCIRNVQYLIDHPYELYQMKCCNYNYYMKYLKSDVLILNTLAMAGMEL